MKAQCGGYSGGRCPYGYRVENGRLVINDEERPIVEYEGMYKYGKEMNWVQGIHEAILPKRDSQSE